MSMSFCGIIADVVTGRYFSGQVLIDCGQIVAVDRRKVIFERDLAVQTGPFILPGFVDAHIHPESFLGTLRALLQVSTRHGTIGLVADTHEAANVAGLRGIEYFLREARSLPGFIHSGYLHFGAPSSVPASNMAISGATITAQQIDQLLSRKRCTHLAEVMNGPGVIARDAEVMDKLAAAKRANVRIDGHVPHFTGNELEQYIGAGISTCHETTSLAHGREKIHNGMKVLIRWGSAVNNLFELYPLLISDPDMCMFCTDDPRASFLVQGHINRIVLAARKRGVPLMNALRAASLNPVRHYDMKMGLLQEGDSADFAIYDNQTSLRNMLPDRVYQAGRALYCQGKSNISWRPPEIDNNFVTRDLPIQDLEVKGSPGDEIRVVTLVPGQITTTEERAAAKLRKCQVVADLSRDLLKLVVVSRYDSTTPPGIGFVRGFGFRSKHSAIGGSVGHDCHNKCIVGTDDATILRAHRLIDKFRGALVAICGEKEFVLPLPIFGLMSDLPAEKLAQMDEELTQFVRTEIGCQLVDPFNALSFLTLEVIGDLRVTVGHERQGVFDVQRFSYVPLIVES